MSSKAYFEDVASKWDDMREDFFSETVREKSVSISGVSGSGVAIDLGAGTGFITEGLVGKVRKVIAIDESPSMLDSMKEKFSSISNIEYLQGESEKLPIGDGEVNYVFANMYLHHVERPEYAIREIYRVLSKGGRVVITDLDEHDHEYLKEEHNDRWLGFKREDVLSWFSKAGFNDAAVDCIGEKCSSTSCSGYDSADISIFMAHATKK